MERGENDSKDDIQVELKEDAAAWCIYKPNMVGLICVNMNKVRKVLFFFLLSAVRVNQKKM